MSRLFAKWKFPKPAQATDRKEALSADFQLFMHAANNMNSVGHVHHATVSDAVKATGQVSATLYRSIAKLVTAGALAPESSPQALVVNAGWMHHEIGKRQARACPPGCHGEWYEDGTWFDPKQMETGTVTSADWARSIRSHI
ncbi:hypothetical protein ACODT5_09625 [Streptomyces sp. 5.8]|uniref:hypothetical protein n=1 Tax=Streptomyces sp. 5.8 TaxID=3406571 RepID=UPI003BB6BC61